ncbi:hypothetical protein [uncultured Thiodictyon sp.]|jgi:hypothetical protein|uniref:hypothetical protein n=1 Tax=uncultured Thiodictyon sp. TaxID=1846217 RepID=UPI0025ED2C5C|nr:hypothetical protein [uncultured Thiodictyon sp.]
MRLVFIHGRSQQGKDPSALRHEWLGALNKGLAQTGLSLPAAVEVRLPFYGDRLDAFTKASAVPLTDDLNTRGGEVDADFLAFEAAMAEALRQGAGITDQQINAEYGANPKPKGPQNWEWVQAIFRALDTHTPGISDKALETFTRDVYLYTSRAGVKSEINKIVAADLTDTEPMVVVGHSLGSVVGYSVLREDPRTLKVPLYLTVGCPLGVRPIRDQFRPLKFPTPAKAWYNAYDDRDVVALYPLDKKNFPVTPAVTNYGKVKNHTDNRHGIVGYLDDPKVALAIYEALT